MQSRVGVLVEMVTHVAFFGLVIAFAYLAALAVEPSVNGDGESEELAQEALEGGQI